MPFLDRPLDLLLLLVVALLIFGPKRLPEMGSAVGKTIKEFRRTMAEATGSNEAKNQIASPAAPTVNAIEQPTETASK